MADNRLELDRDGTPVLPWRQFKVYRQPTKLVKIKDGRTIRINAQKFDKRIHTEVDEPAAEKKKRAQAGTVKFSKLERGQLAQLSMDSLKELPEYALLSDDEKAAARDKDGLINMIFKLRERYQVDMAR